LLVSDDGRVAILEIKAERHDQMLNDLREAVSSLEARMDRRFEAVDRRFEAIDRRFEAIDQRLEGLDAKMSRQFVWLVGLQVTSLIAIVGALSTVIAALLAR